LQLIKELIATDYTSIIHITHTQHKHTHTPCYNYAVFRSPMAQDQNKKNVPKWCGAGDKQTVEAGADDDNLCLNALPS
jgi:hypothetical protein